MMGLRVRAHLAPATVGQGSEGARGRKVNLEQGAAVKILWPSSEVPTVQRSSQVLLLQAHSPPM